MKTTDIKKKVAEKVGKGKAKVAKKKAAIEKDKAEEAAFRKEMRDAMSDVLMTSDSDISQVLLAFDMDEEHIYPHMGELMSAFTAGNDDALLFQVLREEKALVDEIDSYIEHLGRFSRLVIRYDVRQELLTESLRKVFALLARGGVDHLPNLQAWKKRVEMRPAWQRAIEKGGPFELPGE